MYELFWEFFLIAVLAVANVLAEESSEYYKPIKKNSIFHWKSIIEI